MKAQACLKQMQDVINSSSILDSRSTGRDTCKLLQKIVAECKIYEHTSSFHKLDKLVTELQVLRRKSRRMELKIRNAVLHETNHIGRMAIIEKYNVQRHLNTISNLPIKIPPDDDVAWLRWECVTK